MRYWQYDGSLIIGKKDEEGGGWYIKVPMDGGSWHLFEVPRYGGNANFVDEFFTFEKALAAASNLM